MPTRIYFHVLMLLGICIINLCADSAAAQESWNGKRCAVVLTYDDALEEHLDNAIPKLDALQLKATFYLTASFSGAANRLNDWRKVAQNGHELGNHTLFHPCEGGRKGREWVGPDYDLNKYSVKRMLDEIRMTNNWLQTLDAKTGRSFAFTCGDMTVEGIPFMDSLRGEFVAARAVRNERPVISTVDVYNLPSYMVNGETADEMIGWVKQAEQTQSVMVFLFHGVNGGNALNVDLQEHNKLLQYLHDNRDKIWVTTVVELANYINARHSK